MVEVQEATSTADGAERPGRRRPRWLMVAGGALVVLVVLVAWWFASGADDRALRDSLVGRRFVVSSITDDGRPKVLVGPALDGEPAVGRITFDEGYVSSSGGCNSTTRDFGVVDGRLAVSSDGSTTMAACADDVMAQDNWLDRVLTAAPSIVLVGDRLTLRTDSTTIELLERAEPPDPPAPTITAVTRSGLMGRTFVATAALVGGVERRIVGPADQPEPHRLRITFGEGTVSVGAGCNSGTGPYILDRGRIEGLGIDTEMACDPVLLEQDEWLNDFFATPPSITFDGDYLTLGNQIDTIIVFVDEAATTPLVGQPEVLGTRWNLDVAASLPELAPDERPLDAYLILTGGERPTVYGRDGCNVFDGDVRIEAESATTGTITMGDLDRTDASCPATIDPVVAAMAALQDGDWSYVLDGTQLRLTADGRTVVFREA
jgi:heat shock protein HslJ